MQLIGCVHAHAHTHTPFMMYRDASKRYITHSSKGAKEAIKISWDVKPNVQIWSEIGKKIITIVKTFILAPCKNDHLLSPHERH